MALTLDILARAISVRLIFLLHSAICTWRVVDAQDETWRWALLLIPLLLIPEGALTLMYSKNGEWQMFRPCIFIYLSSVVPNIWVLEYDILQNRLSEEIEINGKNVSLCSITANDNEERAEELFEKGTGELLLNITIGDNFRVVFPDISAETWSVVLQQALLFILIVGRWTLPRGHLGHQRLSNLLLLQIAMAADILEFLSEGVRTEEVACEKSVVIGALALWSLSLLQLPFHWDTKVIRRISTLSRDQEKSILKRCSESEIWDITMAVCLLDLPFLCMRLYFLFELEILDQSLLFFIAKNILVLVLQFYRLWALLCIEVDAHGDVSNKLANRIRATFRGSRNRSQDARRSTHHNNDNFKVVEDSGTFEKNMGFENGEPTPSEDVERF